MRLRVSLGFLGLVIFAAATVPIQTTTAAWTDRGLMAADVSAGTWTTPPPLGAITCYSVDPAYPAAQCQLGPIEWRFWGNGYQIAFGVTSNNAQPFLWEARIDLSQQYTGAYQDLGEIPWPMFPGYPVPGSGGNPWPWDAWYPNTFNGWNYCFTSDNVEVPVVTIRGSEAWNRLVGVNNTIPAGSMGVQTPGGTPPQGRACPP